MSGKPPVLLETLNGNERWFWFESYSEHLYNLSLLLRNLLVAETEADGL